MNHAYNVTFVSDHVCATVTIETDVDALDLDLEDDRTELSLADENRIEVQSRRLAASDGVDLSGAAMEDIARA